MTSPTGRSRTSEFARFPSPTSDDVFDKEDKLHFALKPYPPDTRDQSTPSLADNVDPPLPVPTALSPSATTSGSSFPTDRCPADSHNLRREQLHHSAIDQPLSVHNAPALSAASEAGIERSHSLTEIDGASASTPASFDGAQRGTEPVPRSWTPMELENTSETKARIPSFAGEDSTPVHNPQTSSEEAQHRDLQSSHRQLPDSEDESETDLSDLELEDQEMRSDDEELGDDEETGLTSQQKQKRRRRRKRLMRLGERVAHDGQNEELDEEHEEEEEIRAEQKLANAYIFKDILVNACLVGAWYTFSISISVYNKWMFSSDNLDFHFPLFTTSIHMIVQFSLSSLVLWLMPRFRPRVPASTQGAEYTPLEDSSNLNHVGHNGSAAHGRNTSGQPPSAKSQPLMTHWFYLSRIGPCGAATAMDIGLGNFSLRFISLTFFTMCKSSVLGFVLIFAFLFQLEKPTWKLCAVIIFMTIGVVMMVAGETAFNALGFILVMSASLCSGFRWSLTQILLLRNPATNNPFSSIFFLTPVMFLSLIILAFPIEGITNVIAGFRTLVDARGAVLGVLFMLFPGVLAFLMVAAEFALLKRTSVVTLSVCGIFKEVLTISAASLTFGDELSPINVSGLFITIASIAGYNYIKYAKLRIDAHNKAIHQLDATPPASRQSSARPSFASVRSTGSFRRDPPFPSSTPSQPSAPSPAAATSTNRYSISSTASSSSTASARNHHHNPPVSGRQTPLLRALTDSRVATLAQEKQAKAAGNSKLQ